VEARVEDEELDGEVPVRWALEFVFDRLFREVFFFLPFLFFFRFVTTVDIVNRE
jgi:hypothetical protein